MTRLNAIFSLISPCGTFADIGCDHGFTARYALNFAKKVIATDIGEECLKKAKRLLQGCKNIEFRLGDGLKPIIEPVDLICISGMGGHTITDILKDYGGGADLILQPQNDVFHVREFLMNNGYIITADLTAKEKGKYYDVLKAVRGTEFLDEKQLKFGKFYKNMDALLVERLKRDYESIKTYKATAENLKKLEEVESIWSEFKT